MELSSFEMLKTWQTPKINDRKKKKKIFLPKNGDVGYSGPLGEAI